MKEGKEGQGREEIGMVRKGRVPGWGCAVGSYYLHKGICRDLS